MQQSKFGLPVTATGSTRKKIDDDYIITLHCNTLQISLIHCISTLIAQYAINDLYFVCYPSTNRNKKVLRIYRSAKSMLANGTYIVLQEVHQLSPLKITGCIFGSLVQKRVCTSDRTINWNRVSEISDVFLECEKADLISDLANDSSQLIERFF